MMNEISKLAVFVGDKKGIEEADVDQATAGQRSFRPMSSTTRWPPRISPRGRPSWPSSSPKARGPRVIVGRLAGFFRNVLAAQTWLREKSRTKDEIFQGFFPYISKGWGDLYRGEITTTSSASSRGSIRPSSTPS